MACSASLGRQLRSMQCHVTPIQPKAIAFIQRSEFISRAMNAAALVTGASRGIGRGIALELAGAGFDLVINYARDSAAADETANACSARARAAGKSIRTLTAQADISIAADRRRLLDTAWENFGR